MDANSLNISKLSEKLPNLTIDSANNNTIVKTKKRTAPRVKRKKFSHPGTTIEKVNSHYKLNHSKTNKKLSSSVGSSVEQNTKFSRKHLSVIHENKESKITKVRKKRSGSKSFSYTFNKENHHDFYLNKLYERYGVLGNNPSKEACLLIDVCEGQLSRHVHKYYKHNEEGSNNFYAHYYLGFYHHADPVTSINFINKTLKQPLLQKNKKKHLYSFAKKLLLNLKLYQGPKYTEWLNCFGQIKNRSFQAYYNSIFDEINTSVYTDEIDNYKLTVNELTDFNLIYFKIRNCKPNDVASFIDILNKATKYYLSFISDSDFLDANGSGKQAITSYSYFFNTYLVHLLINYIYTPQKNKNAHKNQVRQTSKEFMEFIYKCLIYATEENFQDIGQMIFAFVNTYAISQLSREYQSKKTRKLIAEYDKIFDAHYDPIYHFRAVRENPNARWPLNAILNELSKNSEQPILANYETCMKEGTIKLTNQQTIYNTGRTLHLFRNSCNDNQYVNEENQEELDFGDFSEMCEALSSLLEAKLDLEKKNSSNMK